MIQDRWVYGKKKATSCTDSTVDIYGDEGLLVLDLVTSLAARIASLESLDTSGSIDNLLLACEEWVAGIAKLHPELFSRAAYLERVPACAGDCCFVIFWVYSSFHSIKTSALILRGGPVNLPR